MQYVLCDSYLLTNTKVHGQLDKVWEVYSDQRQNKDNISTKTIQLQPYANSTNAFLEMNSVGVDNLLILSSHPLCICNEI